MGLMGVPGVTGEQQAERRPVAGFGVGSMPPELDRVNWGSFFFGWIWAAAYGVWPWFVLMFVVSTLSRQLGSVSGDSQDRVFVMTVAVLTALGSWGLPALFALRANRIMWRYEQERLEGASHPAVGRPSPLVAQYLSSQRTWARVGIAVYVFFVALSAPWEVFGGTWTEIPVAQIYNLVGLAAILALLLRDWLAGAKLTSASS